MHPCCQQQNTSLAVSCIFSTFLPCRSILGALKSRTPLSICQANLVHFRNLDCDGLPPAVGFVKLFAWHSEPDRAVQSSLQGVPCQEQRLGLCKFPNSWTVMCHSAIYMTNRLVISYVVLSHLKTEKGRRSIVVSCVNKRPNLISCLSEYVLTFDYFFFFFFILQGVSILCHVPAV